MFIYSVDYKTTGPPPSTFPRATVSEDYLPVSGTITWDNGDSSDKYITITVINDLIYEKDNEIFTLYFSNPHPSSFISSERTVQWVNILVIGPNDEPIIDCVVSEFPDEWSACAMTCKEGGVKYRYRDILVSPQNGGSVCPVLEEKTSCQKSFNLGNGISSFENSTFGYISDGKGKYDANQGTYYIYIYIYIFIYIFF